MTTGQALEKARPQERALIQAANALGIKCWEVDGVRMIDLSDPSLNERFNVLSPSAVLMQADPSFTPSMTALKLDPSENGGDVYAIESTYEDRRKKMKAGALLKVALEKLGEAAGIEALPPRIVRNGDDLTVTAFIKVRKPDGTFKILDGSREWIKADEYEKVVSSCPQTKYNSDEPLSEADKAAWISKNWSRVREFRLPMTESKAYLRAYRRALKVKAKYTPAELQKPFLVVSTSFTPDMSDPRVLATLLSQGQQAQLQLYGAPATVVSDDTGEFTTGEVIDPDTGEVMEASEPAPQAAAGHDSKPDNQPPVTDPERTEPDEDKRIPRGKYAGVMLSVVCRDDPAYARAHFLEAAAPLGLLTSEWLIYFHGAERDDFSDVTF